MKLGGINVNHALLNRQGFTLFEIFLALLILAIAIIPMVNAFAPALLSTSQGEEQAVLTGQARQTMNRLLDLDFLPLDANRGNPLTSEKLIALFGSQAEVNKEKFDYNGQTYAPDIYICATNASGVPVPDCVTNASDGTVGLLELKVILKNVTLQTLKAAR
jgi:type II secretory pathway pseudopilin PulG